MDNFALNQIFFKIRFYSSGLVISLDALNFFRAKKLQKQNEKLQQQLTEARSSSRDLRNQLADAEEFKVSTCGLS